MELLTLLKYLSSPHILLHSCCSIFSVVQCFVDYCWYFCFFLCATFCLSFFDSKIPITPLISSKSFYFFYDPMACVNSDDLEHIQSNYLYSLEKYFKKSLTFFFFFTVLMFSLKVRAGLPNNSYKPITNTAWVRIWLCKLQKRVHSTRSCK